MDPKDALQEYSPAELGRALSRFRRTLQSAHRSSIDVKNSYDFYVLAFKEFAKENYSDAFLYYDRAKYELTGSVNDAKHNIRGLRIHSSRTLSFFFKLYGLYAVVFGIAVAVFFGLLIYYYSNATMLDVPLWSSFFAGLGSSAQILTGAVDDLRKEGIAVRYRRIWYMAIPALSMIFGFMAYLIFSSGLVAFNVNSKETIFSTMLVCFLTGFMTNWLIDQLSKLSKNM
ncbi:MAG TPA: hypothetical protein PLI05_04005 [Methanotrichaceae archaeon]|nr:hypothetical protein [Methanotrichaceae archaeon]HQF16217.1 hypothetical protein [Methanotrichaceae archaeon]HQI90953.1 hypothetical protein [Methanotrichaceae archaeon]HQJ28375.1 hypothetical protein [Methanotrichaceae archaeon]